MSWLNFLNKENCFLLFFDDFFLYSCVRFSGLWVQVRGLCIVSDFLAYGYRSEGCASWASPLTPLIFLTFSLSAQCVRHFARLLIKSALFYVLVEFFKQRKLFFAVFWWFFLYPCVRFSGIWVQVRGLCLLSQPSDTLYFFWPSV